MDITEAHEGDKLVVTVSGRLNTTTAPQLEARLGEIIPDTEKMVLNFKDLDYISSAGLRVVLSAQKAMNRKSGTLIVQNVKPEIYDVFEMTGFLDFLTVE